MGESAPKPGPTGSMWAQERSEPRHAQASGPTRQTSAEWYRPSGRADERPQYRTHTGRATNRESAHVPNKTPSGAQNLDRRGLDFDGNVLEIRSLRRTTACWRSLYAAPLRRSSLCSCPCSLQVSPPLWSSRAHCPVQGYHRGRLYDDFPHLQMALLGRGSGCWEIHIYILPIVSSASLSLHALFQTMRRHRCRLFRQRLDFSSPSRVVVTSDLVGGERRWSRSDWQCNHSCCRHGDVSQETTRQARALRTRRRAVSSRSMRRGSIGKRRVAHSSILLNSPSSIRNACSGSSPDSGVKVEGSVDGITSGRVVLIGGSILSSLCALQMWMWKGDRRFPGATILGPPTGSEHRDGFFFGVVLGLRFTLPETLRRHFLTRCRDTRLLRPRRCGDFGLVSRHTSQRNIAF